VVGDGNGDGVVDSTQADVTSVSFRLTDQISQNPTAPATFITLVGDSKDGAVDTTDSNSVRLTNVTQTDAPANLPEGVSMPLGLISFTANVGIAGITETFSLYVSDGLGINGYWKQDSEGAWVNLASAPYGGKVTDLGDTLRLDFQIQDGGEFDSNPTAGIITDPGAAGHIPLSLLDHSPSVPHDGFWF
jgi:hypothetical protein